MRTRLFQPLLFFFAKCTRNELIRQIEFLKAENEMLRKRVSKKMIYLNSEVRNQLMNLGPVIGYGSSKKNYRRRLKQTRRETAAARLRSTACQASRDIAVNSRRESGE